MFEKIFNLFKQNNIEDSNTETIDKIFNSEEYTSDVVITNIDLDKFDDPIITNNNKEKTILFMDDVLESDFLFDIDFNNIKEIYKFDVYKDINLVKCLGKEAGFIASKYLSNNKVDYAILDITLGTSIKLSDGSYVEYDGVDIALTILKDNPNAKILFCTAHTLNKQNPLMKYYYSKYETNTGKDIDDNYLNKNDDRVAAYVKLLDLKE